MKRIIQIIPASGWSVVMGWVDDLAALASGQDAAKEAVIHIELAPVIAWGLCEYEDDGGTSVGPLIPDYECQQGLIEAESWAASNSVWWLESGTPNPSEIRILEKAREELRQKAERQAARARRRAEREAEAKG